MSWLLLIHSRFYVLLTVHRGIILVNIQLDAQFFSVYVYFDTLHVSNNHVLIIRRLNFINTTSGIVTVWYVGTCIPDGHLYRVTYARCRIDKIESPDDEHMVARNMQSIEINIYGKELYVKLDIYKNYHVTLMLRILTRPSRDTNQECLWFVSPCKVRSEAQINS